MTPGTDRPRIPLLGRNAAVERSVRERTWLLEQRVAELERERQDLGRILRGLGEGVVAVDRSGVVVHANPAAVTLLGLDPSCMGSHMFVAIPHRGACDVIEDVMRGGEGGRVVREVVIERPEGDAVLLVTVRPLRKAGAEDAEPEGAIAVVRDVTELRRLERSRQDFFGNVSHELKTPITAIRGAIETILDDPAMPDDVRARFLGGARRHAVRLGSLVTDLLALARLESGPRALQRGDVDLGALVGEVLAAAEGMAGQRGVVLELGIDSVEGAPRFSVAGDEEALRQAITNLVDNAVAHSDDGDAVRVALARERDQVRIEVQDQGSGIPPDAIDRVFERFYRVDADRSRARGGTGIGLSIVKHVAQAHGGSVAVTSELGSGSTFVLQLPVSAPRERGTPPSE